MHQFTIHPSSHHPSLHHPSSHHPITTSSHHPTPNFQHAKNLRKSARNSSSHHPIILHPSSFIPHPTSSMQKICEKLITTSPHHHITSFFLISGFSSTKFSGVRLGIKRSERSNISTKKARYNNIIIGFCSERTEYKLKG